jgi:hypothetical protein
VCHSGPNAGSTDLLISVTRESQNIVHTNPYLFYFFFPQILTAFSKLKIMSEVVHDKCKRLKLFTGFIK